MLTLADASSYFDRTEVYDPDSVDGDVLFYAQVGLFDDARRDAGPGYRRTMSVAPGTVIPANRAIKLFGQVWLVGLLESDGLEQLHRDKYVLQLCGEKLSHGNLGSFVSGSATNQSWAAVEWTKDGKELGESSSVVRIYNIVFAKGTEVKAQDVVWYAGRAFIALTVNDQPSGFRIAESVELDYPVQPATISARVYDPVAGGYTAGGSSSVPCARVRWQSLFAYRAESAVRYQEGDDSLVFPLGTALNTSTSISMNAETWRVMALDQVNGALIAHGRPTWA